MSRIDRQLENALIAWVRSVLGSSFPVIWDKQGITRPPLPYATLNAITAGNCDELIMEKEMDDTEDHNVTITSREEMTISANIFDKGQNCIKKVAFSADATGGSFQIVIGGETTAAIAWNASAAAIQAAFAALTEAYRTKVTLLGTAAASIAGFSVEFVGTHANDALANFSIIATALTKTPAGTITGACTELQAGLAGDYFRKLGKLKKSFQDDEILLQLNTAGLYPVTSGAVLDLTQLLDTEYEFRGQCDFRFGYVMVDAETPQQEILRISGTILDNPFDVTKPI